MTEANETRGEISLELGGTEYTMRPTYEAIQAIEKKLGRGIVALARDCSTADITLSDAGLIAAECIRAHGRHVGDSMLSAVSADKLAEMILEAEDGAAGAMGRIAVLLGLAATGGYTAQGELKAKATGNTAKA